MTPLQILQFPFPRLEPLARLQDALARVVFFFFVDRWLTMGVVEVKGL